MLNTFIELGDVGQYYSEATEYDSSTLAVALRNSFGLVCSYLAPHVRVPLTEIWDGDSWEAPSILKVCQGQFLSYLLQTATIGYREDLAALYSQTIEILNGITAGELNIDGVPSAGSVGWTVLDASSTSGMLYVAYPRHYGAVYPTTIKIQIDSVASGLAVGVATFKYGYPLLGSSWESEGLTTVKPGGEICLGYENLCVGFQGTFNPGDYWIVAGQPAELVEQPTKLTTLTQRTLSL